MEGSSTLDTTFVLARMIPEEGSGLNSWVDSIRFRLDGLDHGALAALAVQEEEAPADAMVFPGYGAGNGFKRLRPFQFLPHGGRIGPLGLAEDLEEQAGPVIGLGG